MPLDIDGANEFFSRLAAAVARRRLLTASLALAAVVLSSLGLPGLVMDTSQESWFLEGDAHLAEKRRFEAIFGKEDSCVILARSSDLVSPESLSLLRRLSRALEAEVPYADKALSLTDFEFVEGLEGGIRISELVPEDPLSMAEGDLKALAEKVLSRDLWRNLLLSGDWTQSLVSLRLKPTPQAIGASGQSPDFLVGEKVLEIISRPDYAPLNLRASGLPVIDFEKRAYFASLSGRLIGLSVLIIAAAMAALSRNAAMVAFPLAVSVAALASVFGVEGHLKMRLDPVTIFLPVFLAMAMSTCYSIHVMTRFQAAFNASGKRAASIAAAARESGWPLLASAATTMAGLLSFLAIPLRPLRFLGLTCAALVGAVYLLVVFLTPVLLSLGRGEAPAMAPPESAPAGDSPIGEGAPAAGAGAAKEGFLEKLIRSSAAKAMSRPRLSALVAAGACAALLLGMLRLEVSFDLRRTYGVAVPYIQRMVEVGGSAVGSLYSYGLVVELPSPDQAKDPQVLRSLKTLAGELEAMPLTKRVTSMADIVEDLNQAVNDGDPLFKTIPGTKEEIAQELLLYESAGGIEAERWVDYDYQRLRAMIEVDDYNSAIVMENLSSAKARAEELFPGARVSLTGALSEFTLAMQYITWGQVKTFFLALASITLVMALTFRSLKIALVAMLPNAVPVLAMSGLMGWTGVPLDIMTVTIVPMLLGLAVDDTIHLVSHALSGFKASGSYKIAGAHAVKMSGRAIALTSIVLILAFSPYLASRLNVFRYMGLLIGAGVMAAFLADLLVTPSMLRLAKAFGPERAS